MALFPDPAEMDFLSLLFMMTVYGYILMKASQTISSGSEMLLLQFGPGIVGGLLIPILGAVPDCAIILLSGLGAGTTSEIQHQISVGVGTLVGSTVMLLTIPWGLGVYLARRDLDPATKEALKVKQGADKVTKFSLTENCVTVLPDIREISMIMMISASSYLIIQVPAFFYKNTKDSGVSEEAPFALLGVVVTAVAFGLYCAYQIISAEKSNMVKLEQQNLRRNEWKKNLVATKLMEENHLNAIFKRHDRDNSDSIDREELGTVLQELGLKVDRHELNHFFEYFDVGENYESNNNKKVSDNKISSLEFKRGIERLIKEGAKIDSKDTKIEASTGNNLPVDSPKQKLLDQVSINKNDEEKNFIQQNESDDEKEDEEDEMLHLTDNELILQACGILLFGTLVCTFVSDPMVDVINTIGLKMNISPFYVSFVVTPIASNASEVISGLIFARKKTTQTISLCLNSLHGAATMNSTLALCIFMSLVYFRGLSWSFSAEVITVIVVIVSVGLNALQKTIYLWQGLLVASFYPISILMVYIMESFFGLD
jgi:Ca2+/Na+ antiporter